MAADVVHAGHKSWWDGKVRTRCGMVIYQPQRKRSASRPTCPGCVAALSRAGALRCAHGTWGGESQSWQVSGAAERAIARHEQRCRNPHPFFHPGFVFRVICCAGCGQKIY